MDECAAEASGALLERFAPTGKMLTVGSPKISSFCLCFIITHTKVLNVINNQRGKPPVD